MPWVTFPVTAGRYFCTRTYNPCPCLRYVFVRLVLEYVLMTILVLVPSSLTNTRFVNPCHESPLNFANMLRGSGILLSLTARLMCPILRRTLWIQDHCRHESHSWNGKRYKCIVITALDIIHPPIVESPGTSVLTGAFMCGCNIPCA